ncbi:ATP-binding protein [Streptomyces cylindrosporus]|uniref:ATP-binding protein n=1 Tax=Streptomyces cylindrosporus TaxID=2927583 RepID=A0ABS9YI95_9ACTN|nr:ATP-binding protein [Streptomyces cylindrosporus]MCI3276965.1 ATP-binding protein [Streptomyces cylindrosporus]
MSAADGRVGRFYTAARRHPWVLGKVADWKIPLGPYTPAQIAVAVGGGFLLIKTIGWWSWMGPVPIVAWVRFTAVPSDELYWLTSSAEGTALVHEILHDGRKHGAGLLAGSHDADELGPDRGLMAYRALARTTDRERARRGLEFVGLDPNNPELLRLVTTGLSPVGQKGREGEFLLTCPRQNTGRVKVTIPRIKRITTSITTTPGRRPSPASPSTPEPLTGDAADAPPKEQTA